jgi:hypothetical protein
MSETTENKGTTSTSGTKPEETSALKLATKSELLPGNRPIEPHHLQIVHTYSSVGSLRPVTKSDLNIKNTIVLSGSRPITAGSLNISQEITILGNRPVASNQIDDPLILMGFLD